MLLNIEIIAVLMTTTFLAICTALGARYRVTSVPWISLVTHFNYFGGWSTFLHQIFWLSTWVIISDILMLIIAYALRGLESYIKGFYSLIHYSGSSGGKIGLATLLLLTVSIYLFIINKVKKIVKEQYDYIPREVLSKEDTTSSSIDDEDKLVYPYRYTFLRSIYYFPPAILVPIYCHFWDSTGVVIHGCARLLYERYGEDNIINFYNYHRSMSTNPHLLVSIDKSIKQYAHDNKLRALMILAGKLRLKGYHLTKFYIENYIRMGHHHNKELRVTKREVLRTPIKIQIDCAGKNRPAQLIDFCSDGGAVFIATRKYYDIGTRIKLILNGKDILGKLIHRNAKSYNRKVRHGIALKIDDGYKDILLSRVN